MLSFNETSRPDFIYVKQILNDKTLNKESLENYLNQTINNYR